MKKGERGEKGGLNLGQMGIETGRNDSGYSCYGKKIKDREKRILKILAMH